MSARQTRRPRVVAHVVAMLAGMIVFGTASLALAVAAPEMDKEKFKSGCEQGSGSFVENADGSFQCNLQSGGVIKCPDTKSQCTYTEKISLADTGRIINGGDLQVAQSANPTPTPASTKPARSVLGGVTTIDPSKLPALTPEPVGNRSGIYVNAWTCPSGVNNNEGQLLTACTWVLNIDFEVYGPNFHQLPHGGIAMSGLPAGLYQVREFIPSGYKVSYAFCGLAPSEAQQPVHSPVVVYDGYYEFMLGQDQSIYCNWFNVPLQTGVKPPRVVGGVLDPGVVNAQVVQAGATPVATPTP